MADDTISTTIQLNNKSMNKKINIAEILKDAPKGTELWSPIVGEITLDRICQNDKESDAYIKVKDSNGNFYTFMSTGELFAANHYHAAIPISRGGMCVLFPSRDCLSWENFKAPWKHKHFESFQKVLILTNGVWRAGIYSHYREGWHYLVGRSTKEDSNILAYEGNESKLGKPVK